MYMWLFVSERDHLVFSVFQYQCFSNLNAPPNCSLELEVDKKVEWSSFNKHFLQISAGSQFCQTLHFHCGRKTRISVVLAYKCTAALDKSHLLRHKEPDNRNSLKSHGITQTQLSNSFHYSFLFLFWGGQQVTNGTYNSSRFRFSCKAGGKFLQVLSSLLHYYILLTGLVYADHPRY